MDYLALGAKKCLLDSLSVLSEVEAGKGPGRVLLDVLYHHARGDEDHLYAGLRSGHLDLALRGNLDGLLRAGHGERSGSQLLLKLAGTENMLILAVDVLAVEFRLLSA